MKTRIQNFLIKAMSENPRAWHKAIDNKIYSCEDPSKIKAKEILTEKQLEIFKNAMSEGYYNIPRRISLNKFSEIMGLSPSTMCIHIQNIEKIIFNELVSRE